MNWGQAKGKLNQAKGNSQQRRRKRTDDDDLDVIYGNRQEYVGRIQERYGIEREEAENQVNAWENNYKEYI